ncbi:MAG: outer membrane beta-barrel protein [Caulobacter sp.]|nr:outer membrane beta-barrel protein [Caulobacter sp.]
MRSLAIITALVAVSLACPAMAQDRKFYVGGEFGLAPSNDMEFTVTPGPAAGVTGHFEAESELGYQVSGLVGYDFGPIRVELEGSQTAADFDGLKSDFANGNGLVDGSQSVSGDFTARAVMANVLVDFGNVQDFSFFVGAGAGLVHLEVSNLKLSSTKAVLLDGEDEDGDWRSAWQVMAGVRKPLTDSIDAHVRYRYLEVENRGFVGFTGRILDGGLSSHSVNAGVTFRF